MTKSDAIAIIDRAQASMRDFLAGKITASEHEAERNRLRDQLVNNTY